MPRFEGGGLLGPALGVIAGLLGNRGSGGDQSIGAGVQRVIGEFAAAQAGAAAAASPGQPPIQPSPPAQIAPPLPTLPPGTDAGLPTPLPPVLSGQGPAEALGVGSIASGIINFGIKIGRSARKKTTAQLEKQLLRRYIGRFGRYALKTARRVPKAGTDIVKYGTRVVTGGELLMGGALIGTAIIGVLYPKEAGRGSDFTPEERFANEADAILRDQVSRGEQQKRNVEDVIEFEPEEDPESFGSEIRERMRGYVAETLGLELPSTAPVGPPSPYSPAQQVANSRAPGGPAPSPPPPAVSPGRSGPLSRLNPSTLNRALLYGGIVGVVQQLRKRGRKSFQNVTPAATAIGAGGPGTEVLPGLTPFNTPGAQYFVGGGAQIASRTGTDRCSCGPKKKRAIRECKERATVKWKTGRRRGQDAGQKCVVYYQ